MFREEREDSNFSWEYLGNVEEGRPNLGKTMDVSTYRLMQFTLRDTMIKYIGVLKTDEIFYEAGKKAGEEFYRHIIGKSDNFNEFLKKLQNSLKDLKIGILRVEKSDFENNIFVLTVAEDLDCSGLPICGEEVCTYDEGFIAGILNSETGLNFKVKEIDCWASGDRVCRFEAKAVKI